MTALKEMKAESLALLIVGAGPAGLAAALAAAEEGCPALLLESKGEAGQKLRLTGGGRCNISNLAADDFTHDHYFGQAAFLRPAFRVLSPEVLLERCQRQGLPLICEEGVRLYPRDGGAEAVRNFLLRRARELGVQLRCRQKALALKPLPEGILLQSEKQAYLARALILCGGGASFPQTGSDGSVLELLASLGCSFRPFSPALTGLPLKKAPGSDLQGLVFKDAELRFKAASSRSRRTAASFRGDILLTASGLSGTPVLNLSRERSEEGGSFFLSLLPDETESSLIPHLLNLAHDNGRSLCRNLPWPALPRKLRAAALQHCGIDPDKQGANFSREEAARLASSLLVKKLDLGNSPPLRSAMLSRGGLLLEELNPRTMSLRKDPRIFAAGELLDIDGECGGFNLQAAFASGFLAGKSAAALLKGSSYQEKS